MTVTEFNEGVDLYADRLYRFLRQMLRDNQLADDLMQDTFEKVWRNLETVENINFRSYLFGAAYYLILEERRRIKHPKSIDQISTQEYVHEEQYSDSKEILDKAIARLPENQQVAIMLKEYAGHNSDEIAEIMKVDGIQARKFLFRAKIALQKYLISPDNIV